MDYGRDIQRMGHWFSEMARCLSSEEIHLVGRVESQEGTLSRIKRLVLLWFLPALSQINRLEDIDDSQDPIKSGVRLILRRSLLQHPQ
jgi:hypothetical protein